MVTGKNKKQFDKWYFERVMSQYDYNRFLPSHVELFNSYPFEMQIGVYLSYYEKVHKYLIRREDWFQVILEFDKTDATGLSEHWQRYSSEDINEAFKKAFKKADELINEKLKG